MTYFLFFFGCSKIGSAISEKDSFELLDCFWRSGGRAFDTAHSYASWLPNGHGRSETCLGNWLADRGYREQAFILTKGGLPDLETGERTLNKAGLQQHLQESLQRLQTDVIDCYMLHRDNEEHSVEEILSWCEDLKQQGLIRSYACSNWTHARIEEAMEVAQDNNWSCFSASSIGYALADANPGASAYGMALYMNDNTHAFHKRTQLTLIPFSSQALGFFSEKYLPEIRLPHYKIKRNLQRTYFNEKNFNRLRQCCALAKKYSCTPNQIALAWLRQQAFPSFPIIGGNTIAQIQDSCAAISIRLTDEEVIELQQARVLPGLSNRANYSRIERSRFLQKPLEILRLILKLITVGLPALSHRIKGKTR